MPYPRISEVDGRLLASVGIGRQWESDTGRLLLTFCAHPIAQGLRLWAKLDEGPVCLWLDEAQWCQWVAPMLVVPSLAMTPEALRPALMRWTLADAGAGQISEEIAWPQAERLEPGEAEAGWGWQLRLIRDDRQLDCRIISAPEYWLESLIAQSVPVAPAQQPPAITFSAGLLAGWSLIDRETLGALQPGDALLLDKQWDIANGRFVLFTQQPLASLQQDRDSGVFTVEVMMDNFDDWMEIAPSPEPAAGRHFPLADSLIPVTVEAARMEVTLQELYQLEVGSLLSGATEHDTLVTLKAGGRPFARGTLLHIGNRLAVRVEKLC
jgi:type III secretion protein Q